MKSHCIFFMVGFVLCLAINCNSWNNNKWKLSDFTTSTIFDFSFRLLNQKKDNQKKSLCDSLYLPEDVLLNGFNDTIIHDVKYAYIVVLSDKYILAFREFSEKWQRESKMEVLINDVCSTSYDDDDIYYELIYPSPNNGYVFICKYYAAFDMKLLEKGIKKEILKFRSGEILDIEKTEFIRYLSPSEIGGYWNYCNQWVVDGEVIFDPKREN